MTFGGNLHSSTVVEISATEPTSPTVGLIWQNSNNNEIKIYDGTIFTEVPDLIARALNFESGDQQVYPHSTTIGDYTQPSLAVASTGGIILIVDNAGTGDLIALRSTGNTRGAEEITEVSQQGRTINSVKIWLKKNNAPTGTLSMVIRKSSDDTIVGTFDTTIDASTLTTSFVQKTFTKVGGIVLPSEVFRISIEFDGGDASNFVFVEGDITGNPYANGTHWTFDPPTWTESATDDIRMEYALDEVAGNVIDNNTATKWKSDAEINPNIYVDMGSVKDVVGIAIYPHVDMTSTEIKIRASVDAVFADAENVRTILKSKLIIGAWNFIRFNRQIVDKQFLQIYGTDAGAKVLAISEIKVLQPTNVIDRHGHLGISVSDTTLNLDGTAP